MTKRKIEAALRGDLMAWQWLLDTGAVWHLDHWFSHMAASLLAAGEIRP